MDNGQNNAANHGPDSIEDLPKHLTSMILRYMNEQEISRAMQVTHYFNEAAADRLRAELHKQTKQPVEPNMPGVKALKAIEYETAHKANNTQHYKYLTEICSVVESVLDDHRARGRKGSVQIPVSFIPAEHPIVSEVAHGHSPYELQPLEAVDRELQRFEVGHYLRTRDANDNVVQAEEFVEAKQYLHYLKRVMKELGSGI